MSERVEVIWGLWNLANELQLGWPALAPALLRAPMLQTD